MRLSLSTTRPYLAAAAISAIAFSSSAMASNHGAGMGKGHNAEFKYAVKHSNFMPTLMAVLMKNKSALELTAEQMQQLKAFHAEKSPNQRADMKKVVKLEHQAAAMSLEGNLTEAQKLGQQSIALRQTIFNQKLRCHLMMQQLLNPEQYAKLIKLAGGND